MKPTKILLVMLALLLSCGTMQAQFGKRLGRSVEKAAQRTVERKAEQKTEEAVGKGIDKVTDPGTYKDDDDGSAKKKKAKKDSKSAKKKSNDKDDEAEEYDEEDDNAETAVDNNGTPKGAKAAEMAYAKSDFVPGDEIIFEDLLTGEQLGEFPSMWDLKEGNAEVASVNGENAIHLERATLIMPFIKEKNYLPNVFTIEFDLFIPKREGLGMNSRYNIDLVDVAGKIPFTIFFYLTNDRITVSWNWKSGGEGSSGEVENFPFNRGEFNHFSVSFNKRAMKAYVNGSRFINIPRCDAPSRFQIYSYQGAAEDKKFIKNVRIAKGAVPLYDRMMTDGKIITYGITFDVGKSTIKPESMGEINRIAKLMQDNPDLKFSVEGHTDSTGSEATNQTLSDARSKAVVDKLVETGIATDRLQSAGKGQTSPIADNGTDEGRAKNRRVEFVKL
jgi:outer membrane protein OmpA-like peptidoglycan-associated protein